MSELQVLIEQRAAAIPRPAVRLDDFRLHHFLNGLNAHNSQVKTITGSDGQTGKQVQVDVEVPCEGRLDQSPKNGLSSWFESGPLPGLLWEYHRILDEIAGWQGLDPRQLITILISAAEA